MEINNEMGNIHWALRKVSKTCDSTGLGKHCNENMTGLQSFHEQEVRIENEDCKEITSEGKDTTIIDSLTENFEQNLTRSDKNLADILVNLD